MYVFLGAVCGVLGFVPLVISLKASKKVTATSNFSYASLLLLGVMASLIILFAAVLLCYFFAKDGLIAFVLAAAITLIKKQISKLNNKKENNISRKNILLLQKESEFHFREDIKMQKIIQKQILENLVEEGIIKKQKLHLIIKTLFKNNLIIFASKLFAQMFYQKENSKQNKQATNTPTEPFTSVADFFVETAYAIEAKS